ncbi:MAG TPA: biopolymer transporter ExbD [Pirellulales bacterium]|jgi:biopolymer transport protein ExbD|nr:biopolymer transporter ExbD [Pirellulales bacterium]
MTASLSNKARAEPNLTPILDMVFQLITFFMLVINFKANLMDKAMDLPVIGSARPLDKDDKRSFFMLNLNNKGQFTVYGHPYTDEGVPNYIATQAEIYKLAERRAHTDFDPDKDELPTTVIIRADKGTQFKKVYRLIQLCQDNGFRSFAFRAVNKAKGT